jgi:hypothetical protein
VVTLDPADCYPPILQYGSGASSDILVKILGADTPLFLWKTHFFFTFFTISLYSREVSHYHIVSDSSGGSVLTYGAANPCSIPE